MELVDQIVANFPGAEQSKLELRRELYRLSNEDLQKTADRYAQIHSETAREVARQVAADPRVIESKAQTRAKWEELQWGYIFHTQIGGKVLIDSTATRSALLSLLDETKGDQLGVEWFKQVAGSSLLAKSWQSADVLDPKKRRAAEAAQNETDRQTFSKFARANGFSEVEANFDLTQLVLNPGYDGYALAQAVQSGRLRLASATSEELAEYVREAAEAKADFLINRATPDQLRAAAREEAEQRRLAAQQEYASGQDEAGRKREAESGKPQLPEVNSLTGEKLDATFFNKLSVTNRQEFRRYVGFYGGNQIVDRMRGIR
jgi:hypothetical protein